MPPDVPPLPNVPAGLPRKVPAGLPRKVPAAPPRTCAAATPRLPAANRTASAVVWIARDAIESSLRRVCARSRDGSPLRGQRVQSGRVPATARAARRVPRGARRYGSAGHRGVDQREKLPQNCPRFRMADVARRLQHHRGDRVAMARINMACAMTDHGLRARRITMFFALVMLAACSQESAEQDISGATQTAKSAPDQSTGAGADCRDEVLAAFRQLKTSDRPYREETTTTIDGRTYRETVEFVPPDQVRLSGNFGWVMHAYYVGIGPRAWANWSPFPWGWSEEGPDARLIQMKLAANADYAAVLNVPPPVYACLGRVKFKGMAYLGYRS